MEMKTLERTIMVTSILFIFFVIVFWFLAIKACDMTAEHVSEKGLKNVIEEVWEGNTSESDTGEWYVGGSTMVSASGCGPEYGSSILLRQPIYFIYE